MLVSSQTADKGGRGFEIAVRMENLRSGNWDKIQNKDHRVRSMHPRSSLFWVVFMFDIANTEIHTWIEYNKYLGMRKSQDFMRFWSYESLFCTILYRWRSVFQWARVRYFCFCATMLDKETWRKDFLSIPIFHMFSCLVSIHSKLSKCQCPRVFQVLRWVLFVRQIFLPPHSEFEQHICTVAVHIYVPYMYIYMYRTIYVPYIYVLVNAVGEP